MYLLLIIINSLILVTLFLSLSSLYGNAETHHVTYLWGENNPTHLSLTNHPEFGIIYERQTSFVTRLSGLGMVRGAKLSAKRGWWTGHLTLINLTRCYYTDAVNPKKFQDPFSFLSYFIHPFFILVLLPPPYVQSVCSRLSSYNVPLHPVPSCPISFSYKNPLVGGAVYPSPLTHSATSSTVIIHRCMTS